MQGNDLDLGLGRQQPIAFGDYLKILRRARGLKQKDLAEMADTSVRHMNFIEKGRATASREMVLRIGASMGLSGRDIFDLLMAGGFAPRAAYGRASPRQLKALYDMAQQIIDDHDPMPAFVIDRSYNVRMANRAAIDLIAQLGVDPWAKRPPNYMRLMLAPGPVRNQIENWPQVAQAFLTRIRRALVWVDGGRYLGLYQEAVSYSRPVESLPLPGNDALSTARVYVGDELLSINLMTSNLSTVSDIGIYRFAIEMMFAADAATQGYFDGAAARRVSDKGPESTAPG